MIRRTFDSKFLNSVINHPQVRPWMAGEGTLDVTAALLNADNFALVNEGGGYILMRHEPGIYECHTQFLPEGRKGAVKAMWESFEYMFARTDCEKVVTQVPDSNEAAQRLAKVARFRPMFRREDTPRGPTTYMGITIDEWAQDNAYLEADGKWFHDGIEAAKVAQNSTLPDHPHDPSHERAVGAAVKMAKAGNSAKCVEFYNRWARLAGYPTMALVSEHPPVFDMGEAVGGLVDGEMEIMLCR